MKQEDKELLLKDLCARLPYEVMVKVTDHNDSSYAHKGVLCRIGNIGIDCNGIPYLFVVDGIGCAVDITEIKPYLRPMSSMTEEEKKEYDTWILFNEDKDSLMEDRIGFIDWLNAHHFDYRGLIEKDLALEAPEDMYR